SLTRSCSASRSQQWLWRRASCAGAFSTGSTIKCRPRRFRWTTPPASDDSRQWAGRIAEPLVGRDGGIDRRRSLHAEGDRQLERVQGAKRPDEPAGGDEIAGPLIMGFEEPNRLQEPSHDVAEEEVAEPMEVRALENAGADLAAICAVPNYDNNR